ncbi:MAG: YitT family protein [Clostridia bacterium]|nr:YitT family protein [Clostridia bacterium]
MKSTIKEDLRAEFSELRQSFTFKNFCMVNAGMLMVAVGVYFFKAPNGFSTGGVSGFSILFSRLLIRFWPDSAVTSLFSMATINLLLNLLLLMVGVAFLGRKVGLSVVCCTLTYSLMVWLLERFVPLSMIPGTVVTETGVTLTDQPFLELILAILLTGFGGALLFYTGTSTGGTDILAMIMRKYTNMEIGRALLCCDALIACSAFFVVGIKAGLYSILGLLSKSLLIDNIIESIRTCKCFFVITSRPEEIEPFILEKLHRSATDVKAVGVYSHSDKHVLMTVCRRQEANMLRRCIKALDPQAFVIITNSSEIVGNGFLPE